jgi:choline monooxygenase
MSDLGTNINKTADTAFRDPQEDIPLCESVQKGLHSKGYSQGRFIVNQDRPHLNEHAMHHFQSKVLEALSLP